MSWGDKAVLQKLNLVLGQLAILNEKIDTLTKNQGDTMADLTKLQADVTAENTVIDSAITLLTGLNAALKAAGTDPAALAALSSEIEAKTTALSAAVLANTPASPPAPTPAAPPAPPTT